MNVLCTDKTGTLTQDKAVLELYLDIHGNEDDRTLTHAFLNSYYQTGLKNLMDAAILEHVGEEEISPLTTKYTKVDEIPFDFNRRRMSIVIQDKSGKTQMITKGAVEEILDVSSVNISISPLYSTTEEIRNEILDTVTELNNKGMGVIAVAQKNHPSEVRVFSVADESEMCLMGYLAFLDSPKESAKEALKTLKDHGADVKILSSDNEAVTRSACIQVGIEDPNVISGIDLEKMNDEEVSFVAKNNNIFAKLSPNQKTMLVSHLREQNHVVRFLEDGINDAWAINESDVRISVDTAVDISKE